MSTRRKQQISRRQVLIGSAALAGASLIPGIPLTPIGSALQFSRSAMAAGISRPDKIIRMSANENPYGPSRIAMQAIADTIELSNRYADDPTELITLIAKLNDVMPENIMVGDGSSEVLNVAGLLSGMSRGSVVCADPTFQALLRYAENAGATIIKVPVNDELGTDLVAMKRAIKRNTKLVYLVNPNNPIPSIIEKTELRDFVLEVAEKRLVFVDEAYHEFVDNSDYETLMDLISKGQKNLIISRTSSKIHGLAGLRIGFGFAHPDLASKMVRRKTGRLNVIGLQAAYASYQDEDFQNFTRRKNKEALMIVEKMCQEMSIRYIKSDANFMFIETGVENHIVQEKMLANGIKTGRAFPPYTKWARISMAKPDQMKYFVQVYRELFA